MVVTAHIQSSLRGPPGNAHDFEAEMGVSLSLWPNFLFLKLGLTTWASHALRQCIWPAQYN